METFRAADHRLLEIEGHAFLFLVEAGAIFEVEPDAAEALRRHGGAAGFAEAEFTAALNGSATENADLFRNLLDLGVMMRLPPENSAAGHDSTGDRVEPGTRRLTTAGPKQSAAAQALTGHGSDSRAARGPRSSPSAAIPIQTLVLHVTEACNLGCLYCYRSHHQETPPTGPCRNERDQTGGRTMSIDTARAAIDFLLDRSGPLKEVVLVFFGGEPFLNFELMSQAAQYARRAAGKVGKEVSFAVTTNGTVLNPEVFRFLEEYQVGVTISVDGLAATQDRYRPFANGAPSYAAIEPNLRALFTRNGHKPIVARVTVASGAPPVPQVLDHLLGLGFAEVGFSPVTTSDPRYQLDPEGMDRLLEQFRTLTEVFIAQAEQDRFLGFTNLVDLLVTLHEGEVKDFPCGAGLGLFSVDPGGRLYLCQRLTGEARHAMGDIFQGVDRARVARFREEVLTRRSGACRRCWVRRICAGGCYHEALVREGGLAEPNRHYCEWIRNWITTGLTAYARMALSRPEYLDRLSLLRGHQPVLNPIV